MAKKKDKSKSQSAKKAKVSSRTKINQSGSGAVATKKGIAAGAGGVAARRVRDVTIINQAGPSTPPPKEALSHEAIGFIPPVHAETYVHRGQVEEDIRKALRAGGATAIVGLHAPGGTGKTELANCVAQEIRDGKGKYPFENLLWINVNEKTPQEVIGDVLRNCGVQLPATATYEDQKRELRAFLSHQRWLVIFDDVRHKAAEGVGDFLPPAPCGALITSRVREMIGVKEFPLDHMDKAQARQLFVNVLGENSVQTEEETMFKLAERCKYNPLTLEIAARRIRQYQKFENPIALYLSKAEKRFDELRAEGNPRWNMIAVFDQSYDDLSEEDQKYFRSLAAFAPSGFSPQAAAFVWNLDEGGAGQIIQRFYNLSLIVPVAGKVERYRLHDLLDEYAAEKLKKNEEEQSRAKNALAEWLIQLLDDEKLNLANEISIPIIAPELDNFRSAVDWAKKNKQGALLASLASLPRNWFYNFFRIWDEWLDWLQSARQIGVGDHLGEANVLQAIGDVQQFRKQMDAALASYNEALKLFKAVGSNLGEANVLKAIGDVQQFRDERDAALASYNEALKLFKAVGSNLGEANVLSELAKLALISGDIASAERQTEEVAAIYLGINAIYSMGACYGNFSIALLNLGNKAKAKGYALKARQAFEKVGEPAILKQVDSLIAACKE